MQVNDIRLDSVQFHYWQTIKHNSYGLGSAAAEGCLNLVDDRKKKKFQTEKYSVQKKQSKKFVTALKGTLKFSLKFRL